MRTDTCLRTFISDVHPDFNCKKIEVTSLSRSGGEPGLRFAVLKEDLVFGKIVTLREEEVIWTIMKTGEGEYTIKSDDHRKLDVDGLSGQLLWNYFHGMACDVVVGFGASHAITTFFHLAEFQDGPSWWLLKYFPAWSQDHGWEIQKKKESQVSKVMNA